MSCQDRDRFQPAVLALVDRGGGLREKLEGDSVPLMIVRRAGRTIPLSGLAKSVAFVRRFRPHLVQGWMYHGNLAASFLELGLREDAPLIGLVARYHPMKDHAGFLRAAADLARRHADVHFVLVGPGVDEHGAGFSAK